MGLRPKWDKISTDSTLLGAIKGSHQPQGFSFFFPSGIFWEGASRTHPSGPGRGGTKSKLSGFFGLLGGVKPRASRAWCSAGSSEVFQRIKAFGRVDISEGGLQIIGGWGEYFGCSVAVFSQWIWMCLCCHGLLETLLRTTAISGSEYSMSNRLFYFLGGVP